MLETCAACECVFGDGCCGQAEPFEQDGKRYCCRGCAFDGVCVCGCVRKETEDESSREPSGAASVPLL
jgi:hypothetical protein